MASVVIAGDVSGTCTLQAANAAGTTVLTLPTSSGTLVATGGAPSFTTVTTGLGNASAPSITFTGDTNTGIFSPTADTIAFTEGGTESMRIDASGNVGIGTSSPGSKLDVRGQGKIGSAAGSSFSGTLSTGGLDVMCGSGTKAFQVWDDNLLTTPRFCVERDGNVLVNTTVAPASSGKFAINSGISSSSANVLELQQATDGANKAAAAFGLTIQNGGQATNASDLYISTASGGSLVQRGRFDSSGNFYFNSGYGSVATAYGCRAWVNFNGGNGNTAGAINANGNVSSVTANGTGDYTVNFTTAMPDANYSVQCSGQRETTGGNISHIANISNNSSSSIATGSVRVGFANDGGTSVNCFKYCVAVFR
jgi:hypothetical protein